MSAPIRVRHEQGCEDCRQKGCHEDDCINIGHRQMRKGIEIQGLRWRGEDKAREMQFLIGACQARLNTAKPASKDEKKDHADQPIGE